MTLMYRENIIFFSGAKTYYEGNRKFRIRKKKNKEPSAKKRAELGGKKKGHELIESLWLCF